MCVHKALPKERTGYPHNLWITHWIAITVASGEITKRVRQIEGHIAWFRRGSSCKRSRAAIVGRIVLRIVPMIVLRMALRSATGRTRSDHLYG